MNFWTKHNERLLLLFVLAVGAFLRFYHYSDISFSNDELSAILRLQYDDFGTLINQGVRPDGHPAFTQVSMWVMGKNFGMTEATLRFLPVIAGILALLWTYLLGRKCFNGTAGLFAAAALVFLDYVLTYSQIARPYPFGLCFTVMFGYSWYLLLFEYEKRKWLKVLFFAVSAALCMYTHYFSFLNALIIGATGLFLLNKKNWLGYVLGALLAVGLFAPHLGILFDQMAVGGVGGADGWLAAPDGSWFGKYIKYAFNDSGWILLLVIGLALLLNKIGEKRESNRFQPIMIAWFLAPFIVGYVYSVKVNPVLQYSTLVFSFPFLVIAIFSFAGKLKKPLVSAILLFVFVGIGTYHTVVAKGHYETHHFGEFKGVAEASAAWQKQYSEEDQLVQATNVNNIFYLNHYLNQQSQAVPFAVTRVDNDWKQLAEFVELVNDCKADYFAYSWAGKYSAEEVYDVIQEKYGTVVDDRPFFNARATLFTRGKLPDRDSIKFFSMLDFAYVDDSAWTYQRRETDPMEEDYQLGPGHNVDGTEFDLTFRKSAAEMHLQKGDRVRVKITAELPLNIEDAHLVFQISREGEQLDYHSYPLRTFIHSTSGSAYLNRVIAIELQPEDEIAAYLWNPKKHSFKVNGIVLAVQDE